MIQALVYIGPCRFAVRRSKLFGPNSGLPHSTFLISLGLIQVCLLSPSAGSLVANTTRALGRDPEYLRENAPSVRLARQRAAAKERGRLKKEFARNLDYYQKRMLDAEVKHGLLFNENRALQSALRQLAASQAPQETE